MSTSTGPFGRQKCWDPSGTLRVPCMPGGGYTVDPGMQPAFPVGPVLNPGPAIPPGFTINPTNPVIGLPQPSPTPGGTQIAPPFLAPGAPSATSPAAATPTAAGLDFSLAGSLIPGLSNETLYLIAGGILLYMMLKKK